MASSIPTIINPAQTITVNPSGPGGLHTHTVVFLHGRGGSARTFFFSLSRWRDSQGRTPADVFPSFRWVIPQAPARKCYSLPTTWNQWFDVYNARNFAEREEIQTHGLHESVVAVRELLRQEAELLGGRWDRIILAGISMGGATSVHTIFNLEIPAGPHGVKRLGGLMGFACRCPFAGRETLKEMRKVLGLQDTPEGNDNTLLRNTPILLEHNADDYLVRVEQGRGLRDILTKFGATVEWKEYPHGGHWFNSPQGVDDVIAFLSSKVVGNLQVSQDTPKPPGLRRRASTKLSLDRFKEGLRRWVKSFGRPRTLRSRGVD